MKPTLLTLVAALFVASSLLATTPDPVTFSADGTYVLASSERVNLTHEGEYWQLFKGNDPTPIHTIAQMEGAWYTVKLIAPSVSTERAEVLQPIADIDAWMDQYQLNDVGQDISESLSVEAAFIAVPEKNTGTLLQLDFMLDGKGIARVQLADNNADNNTAQLEGIQEELDRRAPEAVISGSGELIGYKAAHAKAYRSAKGHVYIHSAFTATDWAPAADLASGTQYVREGNAVHHVDTPSLSVVRIVR